MNNYYKPRVEFTFDTRNWDNTADVQWKPRVKSFKLTKNHYRAADELHVTLDWTEGGVDPRMIKQGRCSLAVWDEFEHGPSPADKTPFVRFQGICKSAERKISDDSWDVELYFQDYVCLFLEMKPFPTDGMPEWTDTIEEVWRKIRAYTGYRDRDANRIVSNCDHLNKIVFDPPELATKTIGEMVPKRMHAIDKPTPPPGSDAWRVWLWIMDSLGLVSHLDGVVNRVSTTNEYYLEESAPKMVWGQNIRSFEEKADTHVSNKGILGKALNTLTGEQLESVWPPTNDPYIKHKKSDVKRAQKEGRDVNLNETSSEYIPYFFPGVMEQAILDRATRAIFEHFSKQELKGKLSTVEMKLPTKDGNTVDIFSLNAGDCIEIGVDKQVRDIALANTNLESRIRELQAKCGYDRKLAAFVCETMSKNPFRNFIYHVETVEVDFGIPNKFEVDVGFHNKIYADKPTVTAA